jgi:hypothetical protein
MASCTKLVERVGGRVVETTPSTNAGATGNGIGTDAGAH